MNESLISVVAPIQADTDARVIEAFVGETAQVLRGIASHHEIILVDDGAPEATVARVRELLGEHDFLRFVRLSRHFGEEAAITAGLEVAIGDYVVVMLPNMDPPSLLPQFIERVRSETDIVYGVRLHRKSEPLWYRLGARAFYWYINSVVKAAIPEDSTQFRCMTRQVVNAITQIRGPDPYLRLLTSYIGFRKTALPYAPINRSGVPTVRPKREAAHLARSLVMDHSTHPLQTVLRFGLLVSAANAAVVIWQARARGDWTQLHGAVAFVTIAAMVAIVGEYVGGISRRLRDRPAYYVREEQTSSVLLREVRKNVVDVTG
jgi:dolichol-phosphate mannosyltransferase